MSKHAKYQLLDPLTDQQYADLRDDIAERGVLTPVIVDEFGEVIDGHHRRKIAAELGKKCPVHKLPTGMSEEEKLDASLALNLLGRQQTREEKRETVKRYLLRRPEASDRHVARLVGGSPSTVAKVRTEVGSGVQLGHVTGQDGKTYTQKAKGKPRPDPEAVARRQAELAEQRAKAAPKRAAEQAKQKAEEQQWRADAEARGGSLREVSKPPARVIATQDRIKAALSDCALALTRALQDPGLDEDLVNSELTLPPEFRLNEIRLRLGRLVTEFGRRLAELERAARASRTTRESPVREQ